MASGLVLEPEMGQAVLELEMEQDSSRKTALLDCDRGLADDWRLRDLPLSRIEGGLLSTHRSFRSPAGRAPCVPDGTV